MNSATCPHRLATLTVKTLLLFSLLALVAVATSPVAQAKPKKKSCAEAIRNDWYGDGQIDKQYELHCYKEAIHGLPVDVKDYQHASEDILRALAYRKKGKPDPGSVGNDAPEPNQPSSAPSPSPSQPEGPQDETDEPATTDGTQTEAAGPGDELDTSGPSSIPIPLLVLGGLALLLLAAGGAGYANRRLQTRRSDDNAS